MTNIQTLPNKSQPTESGRAEMGNFFQAPGAQIAGNLSNPDFDSFLSNPDSRNQAEELREEQEAAKKRKKPVDVALTAQPLQSEDTPLDTQPKLETQPKELHALNPDSLTYQSNSETSLSNEGENANQVESPKELAIETKEESLEAEAKFEPYSDNRGTETAPADDEMIATAALDGAETPTQPLREHAITSINRLAAYATLDRNAISPLTNSGASSDSALGNNASGLPTAIQSIKSASATPSTQAAGLFKSLAPELDKFKQTGSSQIQLDLPVGEEESVRIKLSMRGGEIRSTFITESPELREALQKAWPEFSQNSRDRGYRLGDPSFQQSFQENNANLGQNNRRQPEGRPLEASEVFGSTNIRKPSTPRTSTANSPSTALWA